MTAGEAQHSPGPGGVPTPAGRGSSFPHSLLGTELQSRGVLVTKTPAEAVHHPGSLVTLGTHIIPALARGSNPQTPPGNEGFGPVSEKTSPWVLRGPWHGHQARMLPAGLTPGSALASTGRTLTDQLYWTSKQVPFVWGLLGTCPVSHCPALSLPRILTQPSRICPFPERSPSAPRMPPAGSGSRACSSDWAWTPRV